MKISPARTTRLLKTFTAAVLAAALVALAPGLASYEAAAQVFNAAGAAGRSAGAPAMPVSGVQTGVSAIPSAASLAPSLSAGALGFAPAASLSAAPAAAAFGTPSAAGSLSAPSAAAAFAPAASLALPASALAAAPQAAAAPIQPAAAVSAVERAAAPALNAIAAAADGHEQANKPTTLGTLSRTARSIDAASGARKTGFLDTLFTGVKNYFGLAEGETPSQSAAAPVAAQGAPAAFAALTTGPSGLAASTPDSGKPSSASERATPPSPVAKVGEGLNPGDKLLEGPQNDDWIDVKAMTGMFIQRSISIALFIQTALAYPLIAIHAVGTATFGVLMALGPLAAIATGPLNGLIADKMSPRTGLIMLNLARAAQTLALPILAHFGMLNFWTLLAMSVANGWQLSLLMTSENAYLRRLAGKNHLNNLNALNAVNYLALQVFLTLILGVGAWIDKLGLMTPYWASSIILPFVVVPIIRLMIPKTIPGEAAKAPAPAAKKSAGEILKGAASRAKAFAAKYWKEIGLLGAALGAYLGFHTTLPMSAALLWWVSRTDGFKAIWNQKNMRATMLLSALAFGLIFPFQYMALPLMAGVLGGAAGKAAILSQLLGALFFGQLVANASQANLPQIRVPFTQKKIKAERLVQGLVLAMGAAWSLLRLFPGNWLAAGGAVALGAALMWGSSKFTDRGWIKYLGLGLAAASILPLMFWGSLPVIFGGMLALGLFAGPVQVALNTYFGKNARAASIGNAFGVSSSLNNSATSFGYGLLTALVGMFSPVFPHALLPIAGAFAVIGAIFFFLGPKLLPGLSAKSFSSSKPADKK